MPVGCAGAVVRAVVGALGSTGIASTTSRHVPAVTSVLNCAVDNGGSALLTGAPFSAAAFHSLTLTCCPSGVTRSAVHSFVSTRRSGYS